MSTEGSYTHKAVLADQPPVAQELRPPTSGSVVFLPKENTTKGHFEKTIARVRTLSAATGKKVQFDEELSEKTTGIVWLDPSGAGVQLLEETLKKHANIRWVQLPMAGVNAYSALIQSDVGNKRLWTSAKGAYAQPVAEHALALSLGLLRFLPRRLAAKTWGTPAAESLFGANVLVVGAGGIALSLIDQLQAFDCKITVLRRSVQGAWPERLRHVEIDSFTNLDKHLPKASVVYIAAAATAETQDLFSLAQFKQMNPKAVIVNVARGELIKTDDLVQALEQKLILGAGLDVTAPEPLPDSHKLWQLMHDGETNLIITPHTADTPEQIVGLLSARWNDNLEALASGSGRFVGVVDNAAGY